MRSNLLKTMAMLTCCLIIVFAYTGGSYAQTTKTDHYPARPVTLIVPLPAGGPTDLMARLIAREAEKHLGQPVVIVNKSGGGSTIGISAVATAQPDGYTIGLAAHSGTFVIPYLEKVPYHPVNDLKFIVQFGGILMGIGVKGDSGFNSFKALIDHARANPKKVTYGSAGKNSLQSLIVEEIAKREKVEFSHIPYRGTQEWQTAILGGHIVFGAGQFNYPVIESEQIRYLLMFTEERYPDFPKVPCLRDLGYDIPAPMFLGLIGPKGTPDGIVQKLEDAFIKASREPSFIKGMQKDLHLPIVVRNSKELNDYVAKNYKLIGDMLKDQGFIK